MSNKVTWLLPVRNGMPYLPETLTSIEAQTYTDWEILAWDNGSTDGTLEVLHEWIPSRLPGQVISARPMGIGASLAAMVEMAETDLCARIDADDVNLPQRLEKQVAYLMAHPEVSLIGSQTDYINAAGETLDKHWNFPSCYLDILVFMLRHNPVSHPTVLFRREAILEAGNYRDLKPGQDYDMWLRLAKKHKIETLPEILVHYRVHEKSISHEAKVAQQTWPLIDKLMKEHASAVYGCSTQEMQRMRARQHPLAIVPLLKIAIHLRSVTGEPIREFFYSPYLKEAVSHLIANKDWITRLIISLLQSGVRESLKKISRRRTTLIHKLQAQKSVRQG